jgi:glycosyltransferase involved in cell wall biosynthesis
LNQGWKTELAFLRRCKQRGIRIVHTVHNLLPHDRRHYHAELYAKLYQLVDILLCHDRAAADALQRDFNVMPERIHVTPHGPLFAAGSDRSQAECRRLLGLDVGRLVFLAQGVVASYKGTGLLLEAWARMMEGRGKKPQPLLLIAGHGKPAALRAVRQQVACLRIEDSVRLDFGYLPAGDLPHYFNAADVLTYPYHAITTSGALLTGLNYCKPIIASDLPQFRPFLTHGRNALLVPPGDVGMMTATLDAIVASPELRQKLQAESCVNHMLQTQWPEIGARTAEIYKIALS